MSHVIRCLAASACCLLTAPVLVSAGVVEEAQFHGTVASGGHEAPDLAERAAFIAQYDDGEADAYYLAPGFGTYELAMLFDGVGGSDLVTLGGVDVCWRQVGSDSKIRYEVVIWAAGGPGGGPGAELARYAAVATGVGATPEFYDTDFQFSLTPTDVFIGVRWNPIVDPDFRLCVDRDGIGGAVQPAFGRGNEAGAWQTVQTAFADPTYNALMIRGFVSTPGVFLESLLVPSFLVDTSSGIGTTTLFAVRNLTDEAIDVGVEYFRENGVSQLADSFPLGPRDTHTVNLRDIGGLAVDPDDFARGFVRLSTPGLPDQTPVIAGDFFQVDVGDDFATGEKLVRLGSDTCSDASVRFMQFPLPASGSRLRAFVNNPRGTGGGDPPSFVVDVYDETGTLVDIVAVKTATHVVDVSPATLGGGLPAFGSMVIDFGNASGGVVFAEYNVEGRFSVGVTSQCEGAP